MEVRRRDQRADLLSPTTSGAETGRAIVIEPWLKNPPRKAGTRPPADMRTPEAKLEEAVGLARAINLNVVESGLVTLNEIRPATYIVQGKVDEIAGLAKSPSASVVVHGLPCLAGAAAQSGEGLNMVIDRTGLIWKYLAARVPVKVRCR